MKFSLSIILIFFTLSHSFSQGQFNVILEDSVTHVSTGVISTDNAFIVLSGAKNIYGIRSSILTKVNQEGEILEKVTIGSDSIEYWEGWEHCLKRQDSDTLFFPGTIESDSKYGIFLTTLNFNSGYLETQIWNYDSIWKTALNTIKVSDSYYITGQQYNTESESAQLFVKKVDAFGNEKWHYLYGDVYEYGSQIADLSSNHIVLGGLTHASLNDDSNWYLIKIDTAGNLVWEKNFGHGSRNDGSVSALAETSDSCILACGSYPGIKTAFDTYYDGCLRKIDKNGNLTLERFYRTYTIYTSSGMIMSGMNFSQILTDQQDNYYVIGSTYANNPLWRGFLMKLNKNGEVLFRRLYYSINEESNAIYLNSGSFTTDNGFILLGYGNAYDWFDIYPPQQRWLIKTDSLGMDGLSNTAPDALEVDINLPNEMCAFDTTEQYLYIAGPTAPYTVSISNGQQFDSIYYPPVFVPKEIGPSTIEISYDGISTLEFEEPEVTIANHDWGECIAIPIEFHVGNQVGLVNLDITVTDGWGNSKTTTKSIYVRSCPNGINDALLNQLHIYPNPANNSITIDLKNNHRNLNADIFDTQGKHVLSSYITGEKTTIDISSLPPGRYQIVIENTSHNFTVVR